MQYILVSILTWAEQIIEILIIARVLLSWLSHNQFHPFIQSIYRLTDPILKPFQNIVPPEKLGGIDISPIIAIFAVQLVARLIVQLLLSF